jgi:hypothetical protein
MVAAPKKNTAKHPERKKTRARPPVQRVPERPRPTGAELEHAARELRQLLDGYLRGYRGSVAERVEPLLRHYVRTYRPRSDAKLDDLLRHLRSAAWQLVLSEPDDAMLRLFVDRVGNLRREFNRADPWPITPSAVVGELSKVLASKRTDPYSKANRVSELFGAGYIDRDTRRGLRPERRALLEHALSTAKLIVAKYG